METILKRIGIICLSALFLWCGCSDEIDRPLTPDTSDVPEGYVRLDLNLAAVSGKAFLTRADGEVDELLTHIDDVHLLVFQDEGGEINESSPLVVRSFYEYGVKQNIYLKKGETYFVYVVANLDNSNCVEGTVDNFFDDIQTYGDLRNKHVRFLERTPRDLGKMIMATKEIVTLTLPGGSNSFKPTITLHRLQTQFIVNIYNRVESQDSRKIVSGVYPSTLSAIDMPRYSYLFEHEMVEDGTHDYGFTLENKTDAYYSTLTDFLPDPIEVIEHNGKHYTRQTIEFFTFENRRGSVEDINDYNKTTIREEGEDGEIEEKEVDVPYPVYGRKELAPDYSSHLLLSCLTDEKALYTYLHAGKGRDTKDIDPEVPDDITNFDVDRSCVYHFNVYINSVNDVEIDSRRAYLDQLIIFTLPDVRRIDAHYMDIPSFIQGSTKGYAKMQAGTCDTYPDGSIMYEGVNPRNWRPMLDTDPDAERWLRFSWGNPYKPTAARPVNTSLYVGMTTEDADGMTGATPILHFNEYVEDTEPATIPASDPRKRTAVIRMGFVPYATSAAEYDEGVENDLEAAFYVPINQHGLNTIGFMGGYQDGRYRALLGIENVEELTIRYYTREGQGYLTDEIVDGIHWRYRDVQVGHVYAYDGMQATIEHYDDYRGVYPGGVPPVRWEPVLAPEQGIYNPQSNTNAPDYCMRKNRDEDGNGIIEGDEVKWYLPTPIQVMQMYTWRDAFRGGNYTLNLDYNPFGGDSRSRSDFYWTTNEANRTEAYAVDFTQSAVFASAKNKTNLYPVRCVRDIPGNPEEEAKEMFYVSTGGHLAVDLTGSFPEPIIDNRKPGQGASSLATEGFNTFGRRFLISRWYATNNSNTPATPTPIRGNDKGCDSYSEAGISTKWFFPSQQELTLIYASAGILESLLAEQHGDPNTSTTYNTFVMDKHWGITDVGNGSTYWYVDFATGAAGTQQKSQNSAYARCVTYLTEQQMPPRATTLQEQE